MSATRKIAVNLLGGALCLAGVSVLSVGIFDVMVSVAWTNGSFGDMVLIFLTLLYVVPAGVGSLRLGIVLLRSTNEETYVLPPVRSLRRLGFCLLLPAVAALGLLILGYPHYRFWIFDLTAAVLLALLAAALFVLGIHLLWDAPRRAQT